MERPNLFRRQCDSSADALEFFIGTLKASVPVAAGGRGDSLDQSQIPDHHVSSTGFRDQLHSAAAENISSFKSAEIGPEFVIT